MKFSELFFSTIVVPAGIPIKRGKTSKNTFKGKIFKTFDGSSLERARVGLDFKVNVLRVE